MKIRLKPSLKNIKDLFKAAIIFIVLFACVCTSFQTSYDSHCSFYDKEPNPKILKTFSYIDNIPGYRLMLEYTGLNTGYGFFSPNVSSDCIVTHQIYSNSERKVVLPTTRFKTREGSLRYTHINNVFMERLTAVQDSAKVSENRSKFMTMLLRRMTDNEFKLTSADSIVTNLYLFHYPYLEQYPDTNAELIKLESYTKKL